MSALFRAKTFGFFEIFDVSVRTRGKGVEPVRTFCQQGGGVNFSRFCADDFYGRSLLLLQVSLFEKPFLSILLLTWPNHLSGDLSIRKSSGSIFRDFRISEQQTLSNNVTLSILRKNLLSEIVLFRSKPKTQDHR